MTPGQRFTHYKKGNVYIYMGIARLHDSDEELVIYRRAGDEYAEDIPEARPLSEWLEEVKPGVRRYMPLGEVKQSGRHPFVGA